MATKIVVNIPGEKPYDVRIGSGQYDGLGARIRTMTKASKALLLTDSNVGPLYAESVKKTLAGVGIKPIVVTVPAGESSKSLACVCELWEAMAASKLTRDSIVVALGGGVVGDLGGFAASAYMRGIEFVQVPTTLLAMVDSSVGGKTGVNLEAGKNLVGSFKQPLYVCASTDALSTLDEREWACGCAEIAKSAVIEGDEFFFWLSENAQALARRDSAVVEEAIARSVVFKADVVAADQTESKGVRECLNYGHTLGHAIEKLAGYGMFSHGQAVAEGMRFASRLAVELVGASMDFVEAQDELLDALGIPSVEFEADPSDLLDAMMGDKKVREGRLRFVLPRDVGDWAVTAVDQPKVLEHLEAWAASKR